MNAQRVTQHERNLRPRGQATPIRIKNTPFFPLHSNSVHFKSRAQRRGIKKVHNNFIRKAFHNHTNAPIRKRNIVGSPVLFNRPLIQRSFDTFQIFQQHDLRARLQDKLLRGQTALRQFANVIRFDSVVIRIVHMFLSPNVFQSLQVGCMHLIACGKQFRWFNDRTSNGTRQGFDKGDCFFACLAETDFVENTNQLFVFLTKDFFELEKHLFRKKKKGWNQIMRVKHSP
ncbi:hypothetical protein BJ741DRAFT_352184 [Chytriomyces cf. hyalinus JEL632]|nr:hypothetical protein BJ741DRAFT_352184 [Chytriomyces cf. hyalinus JEL632]